MRSAKRTGSDPGSTACEAAGDVDAGPRLRPHPGLPSLGAPLAPVGAGARMDSVVRCRTQDRPRWRGAFRISRACRRTQALRARAGVVIGAVSSCSGGPCSENTPVA